jgi:hypothetical protein
MPARPSQRRDAAGARPARIARARRLPKDKIHRIGLVGRDVDAGAGEHFVERAPGQRAIARRSGQRIHRARRKEDMILGDIGDASRDKSFDNRRHGRDVMRRVGFMIWLKAAEPFDVGMELPLRRAGDACDRLV